MNILSESESSRYIETYETNDFYVKPSGNVEALLSFVLVKSKCQKKARRGMHCIYQVLTRRRTLADAIVKQEFCISLGKMLKTLK